MVQNLFVGRINNFPPPKVKIDKNDRKIITLLAEDSRLPLTSIAKKVGLSRDAVNYRIRKLVESGIILKFFPIVNLRKFGFYTYVLFVSINEIAEDRKQQLLNRIVAHPNMLSVMEYSDRWDLELTVAARSTAEFFDICIDLFDKNKKVIETANLQVIKEYKDLPLPRDFYERVAAKPPVKIHETGYEANGKDLSILKELSKNCRQSTYDIGKKLNMSPDAVSYRIKKLLSENIITKFTILPNLSALGYQGCVFVINLRGFDKERLHVCHDFIVKHPQVIKGVMALGPWDLMMSLATASTFDFHKTIKQIKNKFRDVIQEHEIFRTFTEHLYQSFPPAVITSQQNKLKRKSVSQTDSK